MTRHLDLDTIEESSEPSVVFRLNGRDWRCLNRDAIDAQTAEKVLMGRVQVGEFFDSVLVDDDRADFAELLADDPRSVSLTRYTRLTNELVEVIFNRPTEPSGSSETGRQSIEGSSRGGSSSPGGGRRKRAS